MEFGYWDENFTEWPLFYENGITNNGEADIFFNFDKTAHTGGAIGMNPGFKHEIVEERENTQIIRNSDGLLAEVAKNQSSIPHFIKSSITTPDDWKRCKEERFRLDDPIRKLNVEEIKKQHPSTRDYPLGIWVGSMIGKIRDMLTVEGLAYAIYDYPDMVEDMVETSCKLVEYSLDQLLPAIDLDYAASWEDICCNSGPLVPIDFFKNVIMPRYKRISKKLHEKGIDIWWVDCDGDVRPILPLFLEGGINTLFPYEVNSCAHPKELFDEYGKELRIMGGFDKMQLGKGPKAIKAYMETLIPLVERGGYIPFCDHRCPPNVKPEDYLYYLDLKEKMFGMQ
jgi:uroporphyrinogen decarboxylase